MRRRWKLYRAAEPTRSWSVAALLFASFALLAVITRFVCKDPHGGSSLWPANASLLAAILVLSPRQSTAVALACLAFNLGLNAAMHYAVQRNIEMTALNIGISYATAILMRRFCGAAIDLSRFRRMGAFIVMAFLTAGVEALLGEILTSTPQSKASLPEWVYWALCDGLGLVLATPAVVMAVKSDFSRITYSAALVERVTLLGAIVTVSVVGFSHADWPFYFVIYPVLVLMAFRAGPAWVLGAMLAVSLIAAAFTMHGYGPLVRLASDGSRKPDALQFYLVSLFVSTIPANNAIGERIRAARRLRRVKASAEHGATHDALTTLVNRKLFQRRLTALLHSGASATILFIDLDRFKQVNDSLGHEAGDELLRVFSARLLRAAPLEATVARFGGDEFAVLVATAHGARNGAEALCADIISTAHTPFDLGRGLAHVSASVGVARGGGENADPHELMRQADIALYAAKSAGRDGYRIFSDDLDQSVKERAELEADLRASIEGAAGLLLHYQPKVDAQGVPRGVEALLRWTHPQRGAIPPDVFIPIAEECGLIVRLGAWVLEEAAAFAERWPELQVAINVSPVQLRQPEFVDETLAVLKRLAVSAKRIELEVTETALLDELHPGAASLKRLREAGLRIALDDFGTGYSSLRHLHRFAVDRVKIDQSFVRALGDSAEASAITQAIIQLGHAMGLQVTAEGVETEAQRRWLVDAGVDELQGYLFSRPVEEKALENRFLDARIGCAAA